MFNRLGPYDPLPSILGGDEPKHGTAQKMEEAWRHAQDERLPEDMKRVMREVPDLADALKMCFMLGMVYGTKLVK